MNQDETKSNIIQPEENQRHVLPLFSTPIYIGQLEEPDQNVKDYCKALEYHRYGVDNGWVSKSKYALDLPQFSEVKALMQREIDGFLHEVLAIEDRYEFYITNSWVQKHSKTDHAQNHYHINSLLSGVYYVEVEEDSGDLVLEKHHEKFNIFPTMLGFTYKKTGVLNAADWKVHPKNGFLILFPSQVAHYSHNNKNDKDRYCIAFNVYVRGQFGVPGGVSDLTLR
jgi:uncharacterized protein (TIGR02466 family)